MWRACVLLAGGAAIVFAASASARTMHYQVTVTVTGPGQVTAPAPDPTSGSIDCPTQCFAYMKQNSTVTFTATPNAGAIFSGWGGDCASAGTSPTCDVSMTGAGSDGMKSITAGFGTPPPPPEEHTLTVQKVGTGKGFVGGGGIDCGATCSAQLVKGTKVTLLAVPTGRAVFLGWGADCSGTDRCLVTLNADGTVTATFADPRTPYLVTLPGAAKRGQPVPLRFRVWDSKGRSREQLALLKGRRPFARARVPLRAVSYRRIDSFRWLVPRTAPTGIAEFCALAVDPQGKRSPVSCSPIDIS